MDPRRRGFSGSMNGIHLANQPISVLPNPNLVPVPKFENPFVDHNFRELHYLPPDPSPMTPSLSVNHEEEYPEDCDFSDAVLRYINQMLMEEDMEDKSCMLQESLDLQAAEKPFYDALGKKYPPSPEQNPSYIDLNGDCPDDDFSGDPSNYASSSSNSDSCLIDNIWVQNLGDYGTSLVHSVPVSSISQSSFGSSRCATNTVDGLIDSPSSILQASDLCSESQSVWFRKGVEEASKFLPSGDGLLVNFRVSGYLDQEPKDGIGGVVIKMENTDEGEYSPVGTRGRKNLNREDRDLEEERSSKQAAVYPDSIVRSKMFDEVLLCNPGKGDSPVLSLREALRNKPIKTELKSGQPKGSNGGKGRGKKQTAKKEVVDLRTLLIHCAQAVAADDKRNANELLKQIKQHSSPFGDGNQRLAHCFVDGLEARLAGTGSHIYKGLVSKRTSAADILKAYLLYLAACPFRRLTNFVSNKTIMGVTANATRIHIIDFGILYGFQWPTFIQRLAMRPGGPPKLKITGIDFPQPGFRPAERVEETGRRLANYAEDFKVPFEYNAIAKKWETIQLEELKLDEDEIVVVNCLYRFKNLLDESVLVDSSRNAVLNMIRKINPDIFIHGIVNGAYNAPFFVTRFREVLFHFSSQFDMLETIVPRENPERMLIEKEIFGREALNVIACEGWERVERPETFKQWQVRNLRAGFVQLPFDREIVNRAINRVRSSYHKDFLIDEDNRWLLHGWKGRIIYALSAWKPTHKI